MALSLERATRRPKSKELKTRTKKSQIRRPWHPSIPYSSRGDGLPLLTEPALGFSVIEDERWLDVESASVPEMVKRLGQHWLHLQWLHLQRQSYWLSRLTQRSSWWSRVQFSPELRIPLPSWFTTRLPNS